MLRSRGRVVTVARGQWSVATGERAQLLLDHLQAIDDGGHLVGTGSGILQSVAQHTHLEREQLDTDAGPLDDVALDGGPGEDGLAEQLAGTLVVLDEAEWHAGTIQQVREVRQCLVEGQRQQDILEAAEGVVPGQVADWATLVGRRLRVVLGHQRAIAVCAHEGIAAGAGIAAACTTRSTNGWRCSPHLLAFLQSSTTPEEGARTVATITAIEGIAEAKAEKLREAGIRTTDALLANANTKKRREKLSKEARISEKQILTWVNHADLMRIKGVSGQYSELLGAAGVDTIKELRTRNAESLTEAMEKKNKARKNKLVQRTPSVKVVQKWIDQAKDLKPVVRH